MRRAVMLRQTGELLLLRDHKGSHRLPSLPRANKKKPLPAKIRFHQIDDTYFIGSNRDWLPSNMLISEEIDYYLLPREAEVETENMLAVWVPAADARKIVAAGDSGAIRKVEEVVFPSLV